MTKDDRVCVAVPLTHNMGFGFGLMAAWHVGACAVMPMLKPVDTRLTDEEHGRNRAMNVVTTLLDEKCSLAVADSHVLKSLPVFGYGKLPAGMEALGGGLTKGERRTRSGSGEPKLWCEVPFTTVGGSPSRFSSRYNLRFYIMLHVRLKRPSSRGKGGSHVRPDLLRRDLPCP